MLFEFELNGDKFVIHHLDDDFSSHIIRNDHIELYIDEIKHNKIIYAPSGDEEKIKLKKEFDLIEQYRIILERYKQLINLL